VDKNEDYLHSARFLMSYSSITKSQRLYCVTAPDQDWRRSYPPSSSSWSWPKHRDYTELPLRD